MNNANLILANFDARLSKIEVKPKSEQTKVTLSTRMYNEETDEKENVKIIFDHVAAMEFRINYFDNMIGAEVFGLYEIPDKGFIEQVVNGNFERRKEVYLLEGGYNYDEEDEHDLLNVLDLAGTFATEKDSYHAYVQNVDAGVYIVIAKEVQIVR